MQHILCWNNQTSQNETLSFISWKGPQEKIQGCVWLSIKKVQVTQQDIVRFYNQYMQGVNRLDMMCRLYKKILRTRRWYIYIWLHSIFIAAVNDWFLYRHDFKKLQNERKILSTKTLSSCLGSKFGKDSLICRPTITRQIPTSTK